MLASVFSTESFSTQTAPASPPSGFLGKRSYCAKSEVLVCSAETRYLWLSINNKSKSQVGFSSLIFPVCLHLYCSYSIENEQMNNASPIWTTNNPNSKIHNKNTAALSTVPDTSIAGNLSSIHRHRCCCSLYSFDQFNCLHFYHVKTPAPASCWRG